MKEKHLTEQKFSDLPLSPCLQQGLQEAGFINCTPIQSKSLPIALQGSDVAGQAQTGTGKTISFLLACFNHLLTHPTDDTSNQPRGIILAPTRELAIQIHQDAELIGKYCNLKLALIYGGTSYDSQKQSLENGVDIVIGTPGRIIDLYKQQSFDLKSIQTLVLDEADRMFDLGFIKDLRYLLRRLPEPENRLNMLFSATLSYRVMELAYEHMNNLEEVKIDADIKVADRVSEYYYYPADDEKPRLLVNLLKANQATKVLVFTNTKHIAEKLFDTLNANQIKSAVLSGNVPQHKREKLLDGFKSGKYKVLVATDVAARGLHIAEVSHVYNYDLPQDAEDYVHRIGRTARAGAIGEANSFLCERYAYSSIEIEKYIGHSIPKKTIENWMLEPIETTQPHRTKDTKSKEVIAPQPPTQPSNLAPQKQDIKQPDQSESNTTKHARFNVKFGEIPLVG